jgi:MFS transporter, AAHS family, 3-hydroxyphenylpropionic acid transporter
LLTFATFGLPNPKSIRGQQQVDWKDALFGEGRAVPTLLLWAVFFLTSSVLYMLLNWLPTLMKARGFGLNVASMSSVVFNLFSVFGTAILGYLIDKYGYKVFLPLSYFGVLAGVIGLANGVTPITALAAIAVIGLFLLAAQYCLSGISPMYYPSATRGFGTGISLAFGRIGSITGPLLAGYVLKSTGEPTSVAMTMLPIIVFAGVCAFLLTRRAVILED